MIAKRPEQYDGTMGRVRLNQRFRFDERVKVVEAWLEPEDQREFRSVGGLIPEVQGLGSADVR